MKLSIFSLFFSISLLFPHASCAPRPLEDDTIIADTSADTACNNPNTTVIYYEGYSPGHTAHMLQQHSSFVNADSQGGEDFQIQAAAFRAWNTPQPGTLSFWRLAAAGTPTPDYVFTMSSSNTTAPVFAGYPLYPTIIAYVYPTQICNSLPLFVLYFAATTDHYYTIDQTEVSNLVNFGWTEQGIAGFVLPV